MNAPIIRLFVLVVVLFGVLVAFTSRWTVFETESLRDNPANQRAVLEELRVRRGRILGDDGTVLARSRPAGRGAFRRAYPTGELFGHPVGYSYTQLGRSGLERSRNEALSGRAGSGVESVLDQLRGQRREGEDVISTLNPAAQRTALRGLAGRAGSVVALDPASGAVRVMVSTPTYDPNQVPERFAALNRAGSGSPLLNRATQGRYAPGSTFKVVTAAAAIDSGRFTPSSPVDGSTPLILPGPPLNNNANAQFGIIDLTQALTASVNTAWARVAQQLGKPTLGRYMRRFGFGEAPPLDYPRSQRFASGEYGAEGLLRATSDEVDLARLAIGQDKLQVTPLQMATVAATVANGGVRMRSRLTDRIVDRDGRTVRRFEPTVAARVMSADSARQVGRMMASVVNDPEGTGGAARIGDTVVAGKTGTAQRGLGRRNQVWFIAFAPVDRPQVAIAVTVEESTGFGGTVAAPIAKQVMETLLR